MIVGNGRRNKQQENGKRFISAGGKLGGDLLVSTPENGVTLIFNDLLKVLANVPFKQKQTK